MLDPERSRFTLIGLLKTWIFMAWSACGLLIPTFSGSAFDFGPICDDFPLTLAPGDRLEVAGPLFYSQQKESEKTWAIPPIFSSTSDPELEYQEYDFLYPLLTYDRFGSQYRWQLCQLLSFAGGETQTATNRDRFTLYPIIFYQKSSNPAENYAAVIPFYGHLQHRFSRDEIEIILLPAYLKSRKEDVYTWNYLFPIIHVRKGNSLHGWQVWPLVGHEVKGITCETNGFGDVSLVGGHERLFALWPFFFDQHNNIGATNAQHAQGFLPLYTFVRSPQRDTTTVLWPFFNWIDDREKQYKEWQAPWPFVVFAHGEGKILKRVLPFYAYGRSKEYESRVVAWPLYRNRSYHGETLEHYRARVLFFLYSNLVEKNKETGAERKRIDLWPLFTYRQDLDGGRRLQLFAPMEPILPLKSIERNYSPLWSVWRDERNPRSGESSQSLLWNLYRRDVRTDYKKTSLLFGLFRYVKDAEGKHVRLFYIPVTSPPAKASTVGAETRRDGR